MLNFNEVKLLLDDDFSIYSVTEDSLLIGDPAHIDRSYIGICIEGSSEIDINLKKYTIQKGNLLFVPRKSIIFHHNPSNDFRVVCFSISDKMFEELLQDLRKYPPVFLFKPDFPLILLIDSEINLFLQYFNLIWNVVKDDQNIHRKEIVKHLVCSVFIQVYFYSGKYMKDGSPVTRKEEMVGAFFNLISQNIKEAKDVAFYADKLCMSPKYLSSLVKKVTGKSAKSCIDHVLIIEIKIMLKSTLTIQEISQVLNFPNQSFFGKYFKKHTGLSPLNYRLLQLK